MKILFLDQSGKPGGAEFCLFDLAKPHRDRFLSAIFSNGSFKGVRPPLDLVIEP